MRFNYNAKAFLPLILIIIFASWGHQVEAERESAPKKTCEPGTFLSTNIISTGTCAACPSHWSHCRTEATEDDINNCEKACGKPTPKPSIIATLPKVTPEVATPTTMRISPSTPSLTSSVTAGAARYSSDERWIYVVIGVTVALVVVAVVIVCVLLFQRRKKQKIVNLNRPPIMRFTVSTQDVSSSLGGYIVQETVYSSQPNLPLTYC